MADIAARIRASIRDVPDFPKPGILFKDITPVLADATLFRDIIDALAAPFHTQNIEVVAGIEARGFILGGAVATTLGAGFIPIRKPGKLPHSRRRIEYALEYGTDSLEVHVDAVAAGTRVLVVDDVLATGGTAGAAVRLITELGAAAVGAAFLLELAFLDGRSRLELPINALVRYD